MDDLIQMGGIFLNLKKKLTRKTVNKKKKINKVISNSLIVIKNYYLIKHLIT